MITNGILFIIHNFLSWLVATVLPQTPVALNSGIATAVTQVNGYFAALADFYPNSAILGATVLLLVLEGSYWAYKAIRWAYSKIPGIT